MCPDFIPNRGNLVSEQRYDDGDVCDHCIKSDRVVKALEHQIEDYKVENKYLKQDIDRLRGVDGVLKEGCKIIKNFIACVAAGCTILFVVSLLSNCTINPEVTPLGMPVTILSFIGASLGWSIHSSNFIEILVRIYIASREGK